MIHRTFLQFLWAALSGTLVGVVWVVNVPATNPWWNLIYPIAVLMVGANYFIFRAINRRWPVKEDPDA